MGRNRKYHMRRWGSRIAVWIPLFFMFMILVLTGVLIHHMVSEPKLEDDFTYHTGTGTSGDPSETAEPSDSSTNGRRGNCYNFLVMSFDRKSNSTDSIMLVNFNGNADRITVLQIPRDTLVCMDGRYRRINSLFNYFSEYDPTKTEEERNADTMKLLISFLQRNMNVKIDDYVLLDIDGFRAIVDELGGVRVNVPTDMQYEDPYQDLVINLKAGEQVLNGEQAEGFVRFRSGFALADLGRLDAQKIFMSALISQLKESVTVTRLPGLISTVFQYVQTSIDFDMAVRIGSQALSYSLQNVVMMTADGGPYSSGADYYVLYHDSMFAVLQTYFNVFEAEIPVFDPDEIFTDRSNTSTGKYGTKIHDIYTTPFTTLNEYDAGTVNEEGIYIPLVK